MLSHFLQSGADLIWMLAVYAGVLVVVVFVHEIGHYVAGRLVGARIDAVAVGFGRELVGLTDRRGVRWKLCAVPLGGYVRFAGDADASGRPARCAVVKGQRDMVLALKSVPRRAFVYAAGPAANVVLAILVLAGLAWAFGREDIRPVLKDAVAGSPAAVAGLLPGDEIVAIDGGQVSTFAALRDASQTSGGRPLAVVVRRDGREVETSVWPRLQERLGLFGRERVYLIGVNIESGPEYRVVTRYDLVGAAEEGVRETWRIARLTVLAVANIVQGRMPLETLSGPVKMVQVTAVTAKVGGIRGLIGLLAVISVSIAMVNLMPIPVLDGGHLFLLALEAMLGRPPSPVALEWCHRVGFAAILGLMCAITVNDVLTALG